MKVVILAGGYGTRLGEETSIRPKPMVEIGGKPILWHIMKHFSHFGFNEFVILLGYKGEMIRDYFVNYKRNNSDVTIYSSGGSNLYGGYKSPPPFSSVELIDTGENSLTGTRIKKAIESIGANCFFLTYGDGVCDVDLNKVIGHHEHQNSLVTLTSVRPHGRFGCLHFGIDSGKVESFVEKPKAEKDWINGGYMVCNPEVFDYMPYENFSFEEVVLAKLSMLNKVSAYKHDGFWHSMDTLKDKNDLEKMWREGNAPWKVWE